MAGESRLMPEPAAPFAVDLAIAVQALVLAESAARNVLELRDDTPAGNLHIALFSAPSGAGPEVDAPDTVGVVAYMDELLVGEHGSPETSEINESVGYSPRDLCRVK